MTFYPWMASCVVVGLFAAGSCNCGGKTTTLVVSESFEGPIMVVFSASKKAATPSRDGAYLVPEGGIVFVSASFADSPGLVVLEQQKDGRKKLPRDTDDDKRQVFDIISGVAKQEGKSVRWVTLGVGQPSRASQQRDRRELEQQVLLELLGPEW